MKYCMHTFFLLNFSLAAEPRKDIPEPCISHNSSCQVFIRVANDLRRISARPRILTSLLPSTNNPWEGKMQFQNHDDCLIGFFLIDSNRKNRRLLHRSIHPHPRIITQFVAQTCPIGRWTFKPPSSSHSTFPYANRAAQGVLCPAAPSLRRRR
jgi:hypothetical protein